jgi:N-acetylglucosaminyl-diphospho-decaprenol L-rhamnosyltransferase
MQVDSAPSQSPPVTVSIVIHGQWDLVRPLLAQLECLCATSVARVVLTVNVAEAGIATDSYRIPITRIDNPRPQGFGANHNAAFELCDTPWFLVLNPDIRLETDVVARLLEAAGAVTGLVAPRVQEPGKVGPEPYRRLPTPAELLLRRLPRYQAPAGPEWIAGMFMLLRRDAFEHVQGFDERFYMYCEDVDLCARLRLQGWDVLPVPSVVVRHEAQRASQSSLRALLWHVTSLARLWTSGAFWRYAIKLRRSAPAALPL